MLVEGWSWRYGAPGWRSRSGWRSRPGAEGGQSWSGIPDATGGTYVPQAGDNGLQIRAVVTYDDTDGHTGAQAISTSAQVYHPVAGTYWHDTGDTSLVSTSANNWMSGNGGNDR